MDVAKVATTSPAAVMLYIISPGRWGDLPWEIPMEIRWLYIDG